MVLTVKNSNAELLRFRERKGISQDFLSEKTGVSKTTIISIEKGRRKPNALTINKLNKYVSNFTTDNSGYILK